MVHGRRLRRGAEVHGDRRRRRSAPATTRWPDARTRRGSCGRGRTRGSRVMGGRQAARVLSTVRASFAGPMPSATRSRRRSSSGTSDEGSPVLRHRAPLGRRGHRPARHPPGPGDGHRRRPPRADPRDAVRRLPDVTWTTEGNPEDALRKPIAGVRPRRRRSWTHGRHPACARIADCSSRPAAAGASRSLASSHRHGRRRAAGVLGGTMPRGHRVCASGPAG